MNTKNLRTRLLGMFPVDAQSNIAPIVDSIINSAHRDGIKKGREEAAAMIEVLVLGDAELDMETLKNTMRVLRGEAGTGI